MRQRLRDQIAAEVEREVAARMAAIEPEPARPALTDEERLEIRTRWAQVVCIFCGGWHGGLCNRVRRVEMDEQGRPRTTVFWESWEENPRTIWPEDVWGSRSEMAQDLEAQARNQAQQREIQRQAILEAERSRAERGRPESPREIAARVTGSGRRE